MTCKEKKMSEYLPEQVITEILCRLPVKSILRCSLVCKLWCSLIKHPDFITAHLQKTTFSSSNPNTNRYFLCKVSERFSLRFDNQDFEEYTQLPAPLHSANTYQFGGSCNGIICFLCIDFLCRKDNYDVILYNPSIRKSILLPNPDVWVTFRPQKFIGFGYDSRSHDYKVLRIPIAPNSETNFRAELYSLNSNSWKDITQIAPRYFVSQFATRAVVNGSLHWIASKNDKSRNLIMVFDVNDEIFHEISLPQCLAEVDPSYLSVYDYGESEIAVVHQRKYESDIWVMQVYGVVESWVKLATVGKQWRGSSRVMGFKSNGEVLIRFKRGSLASQKLNSQRVKTLMALPKKRESYFYSYVESLVLLDKENDEGDTNGASRSIDETLPNTSS